MADFAFSVALLLRCGCAVIMLLCQEHHKFNMVLLLSAVLTTVFLFVSHDAYVADDGGTPLLPPAYRSSITQRLGSPRVH